MVHIKATGKVPAAIEFSDVRAEVLMVVTMKNAVFWDVTSPWLTNSVTLIMEVKRRFLQEPHGITSLKITFFQVQL
jgi:hypothetical protein